MIAPSFGGIFYNNCWRNGILPVELPIEQIREIAREVAQTEGETSITVDLVGLHVRSSEGLEFTFRTPSTLRDMLLQGLDEIALTMSRSDEIAGFRASDRTRRPWAY